MTTFRGKRVTLRPGATYGRGDDPHGVTESESELNARMQAREDSYGESGEYEAEAAYAASTRGYPEPVDIFKSSRNPRVRQAIADELLSSGRQTDVREASNEAAVLMNTQRTGSIGLGTHAKYGGTEGVTKLISTAVTNRNRQESNDRGHRNMVVLPDNYREMSEEQKNSFHNHPGTIDDRQQELARRNYIW